MTPAGFRRWQAARRMFTGGLVCRTFRPQNRLLEAHDAAQARWFNGFLDSFLGQAA